MVTTYAPRGYNCAALLVLSKANIEKTDKDADTALMYACRNKHGSVARYLLTAKANPYLPASRNEQPIQMATPKDLLIVAPP